jgi:glycosyltransferase involved in cell wall biosynthesis
MPTVSVIVPNYNHARYLRQRIESVLGQTYQDFEVILLDDCSADDSRSVLSEYAKDPRVRIEFNEKNSGSTFKQWNKGVRLASGEYVWIAESDDYADAHLLERLVPLLDAEPTAVLAYCRSWRILADGRVDGFVDYYYTDMHPQRWTADYWADGREECRNYLAQRNTIPNASAVLFRKEVYERVGGADESLVLCADWKLWVEMALKGRIAYLGEPLNYYRFHDGSVRAKSDRLGVWPIEYLEVIRWFFQRLTPSEVVRRNLCEDAFSLLPPAVDTLGQSESEVALRVIDELLRLYGSGCVERSALANAWLRTAGIHYRQGRPGKAMVSAGRAVLVRPIVAGRPVKRALTHLAAAFTSRR